MLAETAGLAAKISEGINPYIMQVISILGGLALTMVTILTKHWISKIDNDGFRNMLQGLVDSAEKKFQEELQDPSNKKRQWVAEQAAKMKIPQEYVDTFIDGAVIKHDKPAQAAPAPKQTGKDAAEADPQKG